MEPLLFIHVPKTAGTSLRASLEEHYSPLTLGLDYGEEAKETSAVIQEQVYLHNDLFGVTEAGVEAVYGHFPVRKYLPISSCSNVYTFLRDPVERLLSEYKHVYRNEEFTGTLEEFVSIKKYRNSQQAFLAAAGCAWSSLGFIGISERYDESLQLLSHKLGIRLKEKTLNAAPKRQTLDVTDEQRELISSLNGIDLDIYNQALTQFDWRLKLHQEQKQYVHGGWSVNKERGTVFGFAYCEESQSPIILNVMRGGQCIASTKANKLHPVMHRHNNIRKGFVGFTVKAPIEEADSLEIVNAETSQPIAKLNN